jgi:ATP-dependent protease ClpP protease subunit
MYKTALYNRPFRQDEEDEPKEPENPMEKMVSSWQFDKKFIEQRKIFLWGVVDDKSARDICQASIPGCPGQQKGNFLLH